MALIKIPDKRYDKPITYHMDDRLKMGLDSSIRGTLEKKDKDYFLVVDGNEGSGKSTLALQIAKYVDHSFNLDRVVFNAEDFRNAIYKAKKGQAIVFDEAFTGLSSRASLSGINRALVSLMMQMRQKNLFVIIVLPTFFLLDKYVAIWRAKALIHVYESKGKRGYFKIYNSKLKKYLYLMGKKTYSYHLKKIRTRFKGRFYGVFALGDSKEDAKYRKKKEKALEENEKNPMSAGQVKYKEQRDLMLHLFRKHTKMTYQNMEILLADYDFPISFSQIRKICKNFGDMKEENETDEGLNKEKSQIDNEKETNTPQEEV